jgi:recombinational DNA repair protein (RecF pathway)
MLPIEQPDAATFELTVDALEALDRPKVSPQGLNILPYAYAWKLFSRVGYLPDLATCRVCGQAFATQSLFLDARGGGVIHQTCAANGFIAMPINASIIRALLLLTQAPLAEAVRARMSTSLQDAIMLVTRSLMEERYDVPMHGSFWTTLSFVRQPVHET